MYTSHSNNTLTTLSIYCEIRVGLLKLKIKFNNRNVHLIKLLWKSRGLKAMVKITKSKIKMARKYPSSARQSSLNILCFVGS